MRINEIFYSISGESCRSGELAVFVRAHGCPCRCRYCDSNYSVEGDDYKIMTPSEILEEIQQYASRYVIFTGGEPLIQSDAMELIQLLIQNNRYHVEIETCGAVDIKDVVVLDNVTVTMDWKCPSSGMQHMMKFENLALLRSTDVLKFVVGSIEDLKEVRQIAPKTQAQIFISPIFGEIEPAEIVEYMKQHNMTYARFQLQIHKFIYPVDMRGV